MILRPYQVESITDLRASFRQGHTKIVLAAPTGSGKSVMMMEIISGAEKKGSRSLFICERRILVEQFSRHLDSIGVDHGVLMANHWRFRPHAKVQVASAQTLERMETWPAFDLVFIDELHACMRKSVVTMLKSRPYLKVIGATATPFHPAIAEHFTAVTSVISMSDLVGNGSLVPFRVFVAKEIDTSGVPVVAGEWKKDELETRGRQIVGDIVTDYIRISQDVFGGYRKTICFSCGVAHGADLVRRFGEAGINAVQLTYKDDEEYKAQVLQDFAKPDTGIQMLVSADILTRGYDQTDVEHVILARPLKKSFSSHVQMVGRGARPHPGKEFCIARDSLVLTDSGLVKIQDVTLDNKVWDGVNFVSHQGAISRGVKPVIQYDGVTATPDHEVMTNDGWKRLGEAASRRIGIARTGNGRTPIRLSENLFSDDAWQRGGSQSGCGLRQVREESFCTLLQHQQTPGHPRLSELQPAQGIGCSKMGLPTMPSTAATLRESIERGVRAIRWAWNSIQFFVCGRRSELGCQGIGGSVFSDASTRQDRQRRTLRSREPAMGKFCCEHEQHESFRMSSKIPGIQDEQSAGSLCRQDAEANATRWDDSRADYPTMGKSVMQTEREVWDILNAGPLQRFTVDGRLVHNCIIQDNAGNWLRFADSWEDLYEQGVQSLESDADKKARKEPSDKEKEAAKCPKCGALWPGQSDTCAHCGHVRARASAVVEVAGEMVEIGGKKCLAHSVEYRKEFLCQLMHIEESRGYKPGYARMKYSAKFGQTPPNFRSLEPHTPGAEVLSFVRAEARAFSAAMRSVQQVSA